MSSTLRPTPVDIPANFKTSATPIDQTELVFPRQAAFILSKICPGARIITISKDTFTCELPGHTARVVSFNLLHNYAWNVQVAEVGKLPVFYSSFTAAVYFALEV